MNTEGEYLLNASKSGNYGTKESTFTSSSSNNNSEHLIQPLDTANRRQSVKVNDPCISTTWPRVQSLSALILHMNKCAWFIMMVGFLCSIAHGAVWPIFICLLGQFIGRLFSEQTGLSATTINPQTFINGSNLIMDDQQSQTIEDFIIALLFLMGITFLSSYLQSLCWQFSFEKQIYILHQDFFYQLLRQDANWLCRDEKSEVLPNLFKELQYVRKGISLYFGSLVEYSSTFIVSLIIGFCVQWKLMCIVLCMPIGLILFFSLIGQYLQSSLNRSNKLLALSKDKVIETLERIRSIAAWMGQERESLNFKTTLQLLIKVEKTHIIYSSICLGVVIFIFYASFALFTWCGIYLKHTNQLQNVEDVYVVIFSALTVMFSITHIAPSFEVISKADKACSHIIPFITKVPTIDSYSSKGKALNDFKGNVKFVNVSFSRPSLKAGFGYIHHADFQLKPNTITAIIASEPYNTSLLKFLLFRLYDPLEGQIFFDDYDLKSLNVHWLRGEIGLIEEAPVFLSELLIDNILGGLEAIQFDDIVKAAKATFAHELINSLPRGYASAINNSSLSLEDKQIILMVRILLQNPKIVIIEELEKYENEDRFEAALNRVAFGRTVLVFSKRGSTLKTADHILIFQDGWIVADGSFKDVNENGNLSACNSNCRTESDEADTKITLQRRRSSSKQEISSKDGTETVNFHNVFKFLRFCLSESLLFASGIIFALLCGICAPIYAFLLSRIFYLYLLNNDDELKMQTIEVVVGFLSLATVSLFILTLRHYLFEIIGSRALNKLRSEAFASILYQPPSRFENDQSHQSIELATVLSDPTLSSLVDKGISPFLLSIVSIIIGITAASLYCWPLAIVILLGVISCILFSVMSVSSIWEKTVTFNKYINEAMQVVSDAINNLWSIQMQRLENKILESFVEKLTIPYFVYKKQAHLYSLVFALHQLAVYLLYLIIFAAGDHLIKHWSYEPQQIFSCFLFLTICGISLTQLTNQWKVWKLISESANQLFRYIEVQQRNHNSKKHKNGLQPDISGKITFQHVHLKNSALKLPLSDLSFEILAGQLVAIVGNSSGDAVFSLLVRFNEPSFGRVLLDDISIGLISVAHLRKTCNLVCKPIIITGTLRENILYGLEDKPTTIKDVELAALKSGVTKFLWSLPDGWNTVLGDNEKTQLKISDQIRIAIARCFLRDPKIVMIDDIFDDMSEKEVQETLMLLQVFCKNRTCLILTSNEYILQHSDRIIYLNGELGF